MNSTLPSPKDTRQPASAAGLRAAHGSGAASDVPTHPLVQPWRANPPRDCHPAIRHIANWREKVCMPWPRSARLKRKLAAAHLRKYRSMTSEQITAEIAACPEMLEPKLPKPLTNASAKWSEWESVLNASRSNMATVAASAYGLPIWNQATGFHVANPNRNEFWDDSSLLRFLCVGGKMTKRDYARMKRQNCD